MPEARLISLLILLLLSGPPLSAAAACSTADIAAAALAPEGGLSPAAVLRSHSPAVLLFAALSDMAYTNDHGFVPSPRASIWPCLQAWGAQGSGAVIINSTDEAGGVSHATLFRTNRDIFLLFRGLDDVANQGPISDDLTPEPAAAYCNQGSSGEPLSPSSIWVLRGFLRAHKAIEPLYQAEIDRLVAELPAAHQSTYRIWVVGHSDGSSLAQLAAPRIMLSPQYGRPLARLGGVLLFGPQRVGSTAFAALSNKVTGPITFRFQYGWDPAWEMLYLPGSTPPPATNSSSSSSNISFSGTLAAVGRSFTACPSPTAKKERLVATPLGADKLNACGDPDAFLRGTRPAAAAALNVATNAASWGAALASFTRPQQDIASLKFLAHHMPAVFFDGLQRVIGAGVGKCTLAALQLPQCVVSKKCSAALRADPKATGKCATCASNAECRFAWSGAAGDVCDAKSATDSGFMCYRKGQAAPGLYGGLLGLF